MKNKLIESPGEGKYVCPRCGHSHEKKPSKCENCGFTFGEKFKGKGWQISESVLREYVRAILRKRVLREETEAPEIETVGDLKDAIAAATGKKREKRGKAAAKDFAKSVLMDLVPGLGTVTGAAEALRAMYSMPDDKRTGTALDYLDVDDPVSAIVDDNVETRFLKAVAERLESFPDDTKLIDFDMTRQLASFLKKEFENRTVVGF